MAVLGLADRGRSRYLAALSFSNPISLISQTCALVLPIILFVGPAADSQISKSRWCPIDRQNDITQQILLLRFSAIVRSCNDIASSLYISLSFVCFTMKRHEACRQPYQILLTNHRNNSCFAILSRIIDYPWFLRLLIFPLFCDKRARYPKVIYHRKEEILF